MAVRRFIPAAEVSEARAWALPSMDGAEGAEALTKAFAAGGQASAGDDRGGESGAPDQAPGRHRPPTAEELEALAGEAREEGFRQGLEEGRAKGHTEGVRKGEAELKAKARQLEALIQSFAAPLEELDAGLEDTLVSLALAVGKHLVRRELRADPGQVVAVIREAVQALPLTSGTVRVSLHPEDAALVREVLAVSDAEPHWRIVDDPILTRGGCKVVSGASHIDATVETRVAAVVARIMGEEREQDAASRG